MPKIIKAKETLTSKERVRRTFEFEKTDRVTIGYEANGGINRAFCQFLGINSQETLFEALGVDYRGIGVPYIGPQLFFPPPNRNVDQLEGCLMRWVEHSTGGYWDFCDFPLADATDEMFERFPIPNPDDFDYEAAFLRAKSYDGKYALYAGNPGMPDIINSNGRIMGMEDVLCHLILENEAALCFIKRRADYQLKMLERLVDKCRNYLDFIWLGEDLGTQIAPIINPELYKKILKPIHKGFADLAKNYGLPVMIHTCGSSSWAYEDFIEIGIRGVDTLQPEAVNMSPQFLAENFGGRLNFRGCISTAEIAVVSKGKVDEICKETLETMMRKRGYHFAPTHLIQDNTPVENVAAMYNAVHFYGKY